jgi:uroporphyrinogen-III synthase
LSARVLILRPEPGASETAARARAMGLEPVVTPLFEVRPVAWEVPEARRYDAIVFTSANAPRLAGDGLKALTGLTAYAVGEATAAAAYAARFGEVRTGPSDGATLLALAAEQGVRRALHLCARDHIPLRHPQVAVEQRLVYASDATTGPLDVLPGAVVLLHSALAAALFGERVQDRGAVRIAAISPAVAEAAGQGWAAVTVAPQPRDEALLEVARALCQSEWPDAAGAGS